MNGSHLHSSVSALTILAGSSCGAEIPASGGATTHDFRCSSNIGAGALGYGAGMIPQMAFTQRGLLHITALDLFKKSVLPNAAAAYLGRKVPCAAALTSVFGDEGVKEDEIRSTPDVSMVGSCDGPAAKKRRVLEGHCVDKIMWMDPQDFLWTSTVRSNITRVMFRKHLVALQQHWKVQMEEAEGCSVSGDGVGKLDHGAAFDRYLERQVMVQKALISLRRSEVTGMEIELLHAPMCSHRAKVVGTVDGSHGPAMVPIYSDGTRTNQLENQLVSGVSSFNEKGEDNENLLTKHYLIEEVVNEILDLVFDDA